MSNKIFVYVENKEGIPRDVTLELLAAARTIGGDVCAVYLGNEEIDINNKTILFEAGADKICQILDKKLEKYNTLYFSNAIKQFVQSSKPDIFLFGATKKGRDLAPLVSSSLETGLTADCTKLELIDFKGEKKLASTRPTFGGKLMATILSKKNPQMATVRENVIKKLNEPYKKSGEIEIFKPNLQNIQSSIAFLEFIKNIRKNTENLEGAKIILSGGLGLKNKENFKKLESLVSLFGENCAVSASRGAVDANLAPKTRQIGQTGKTVAPKIYIAFGISGAIHHMCGVENAEYIIAVNNDKYAPIFEYCDLGIVEDAMVVINSLTNELCKISK